MKLIMLVLTLALVSASTTVAQPSADGILGEWLSAKKDTRILIYRQGTKYNGKVTWGTGSSTKDDKNPDPSLRNRDVIGLVILRDFEPERNGTWTNGTIYDPREGKTYACKMTLNGTTTLSIRGYIGLSLFGRSEVWSKVN